MPREQIHVVTGAFGYSGKYIAKGLIDRAQVVRTLTNSTDRENSFGGRVQAFPFHFDRPDELTRSLKGATVLYNTYWVRFNHKLFTHADAVRNTLVLFDAAKRAGVERIVHVSITNPESAPNLEYFSGKAILEEALRRSGVSYAILRPAVLFGREDVLINNIAWFLRRFPLFGVFGDGRYEIQPIYVDDMAQLAIEQGQTRENRIIDAVGPEKFAFRELVHVIGETIGKQRPVISIPPFIGFLISRVVGRLVGDVVLTREEIEGLMAGTLATDSPPTGKTKLTEWLREHADTEGRRYTNELKRRKDRKEKYASN